MPVAYSERFCLLLTTLLLHTLIDDTANAETFTLGYITGSKRRPGDWEYSRPGLQISGAITLAIDEVNMDRLSVLKYVLKFLTNQLLFQKLMDFNKLSLGISSIIRSFHLTFHLTFNLLCYIVLRFIVLL
jgi:hypothetical protein